MSFNEIIDVRYTLLSTRYAITKLLHEVLNESKLLSFDVETRSMYTPIDRDEAKTYLKEHNEVNDLHRLANLVKGSSGLSHPSIIRTTHFIFGTSRNHSYVAVAKDKATEMLLWRLVATASATLLVHNSVFDLRILFNRLGVMPPNFIDTSLLAKCFINHVNVWKAKTSLKELMGVYYKPEWAKFKDYEPEDLKNPAFLSYAAIDGAATYHLYELIQEMEKENAV